ncbi:MAG: tripartite tricarboxylate transporter substrate-binding protein [Rhodospirillales bacterium]
MKVLRQLTLLTLAVALTPGAGVLVSSMDAAAAWKPKKPVEFVIMAGKGGGADKMARFMQSIIAKNKFSKVPFTPVNKSGGSGAEALIHMKQNKGNDHMVMVTLNSFYTTPLRQPKLKVDITTFAPVGRMAEDTFLLWVHKDSGITSFDGFLKETKKAGNQWIMAGTGRAQEDQLITDFLNKSYGLKMKYVPYKGGGTVAQMLAGKNANSTVNNPSEALGFFEAGKVLPIASFTAERLKLFPKAPTMKELGKDFAYYMQRSVVGVPGMSKDAESYYRSLFKKVYDSAEWQKYMKSKAMQGEFLTGKNLLSYWKKQRNTHEEMLKKMGEI